MNMSDNPLFSPENQSLTYTAYRPNGCDTESKLKQPVSQA